MSDPMPAEPRPTASETSSNSIFFATVAGAVAGGEIYVRRALPLPQIRPLLLDFDVTPESLERVMRIGKVFGKEHLHILALDATRPRELSFFFTHYLVSGHEAEDLTLLGDVLDLLDLGPSAREPLARTHQWLGSERPATLFVSGKLVDGQLAPAVKLDYSSPRLGVLSDMMSVVVGEAAADMAIRWGSVMGATRASYGGVVLDAEGVRGVRAYFTRWSTAYQPG